MITDEEIAELERICFEATNDFETPRAEVSFELNVLSLIERLRAAEKESIRLNGCLSRIAHPADMLDGFGTCEFAEMSMSEDYPAIAEQESNHE